MCPTSTKTTHKNTKQTQTFADFDDRHPSASGFRPRPRELEVGAVMICPFTKYCTKSKNRSVPQHPQVSKSQVKKTSVRQISWQAVIRVGTVIVKGVCSNCLVFQGRGVLKPHPHSDREGASDIRAIRASLSAPFPTRTPRTARSTQQNLAIRLSGRAH